MNKFANTEPASVSASNFNKSLVALTEVLAKHNIVVTRLHADWGIFGCWEIWAESGVERDTYDHTIMKGSEYPVPAPSILRFSWDGRDKCLAISSSRPKRNDSPSNWHHEPQVGLITINEAIAIVERVAKERLSKA